MFDDTMPHVEVRRSQTDASVNFIIDKEIEARYVERGSTSVIYLSSQRGCTRSCRMCHLTHQRQLNDELVTIEEYVTQLMLVLEHISSSNIKPAEVHVNFMARGEPLMNPVLNDPVLWNQLRELIVLFVGDWVNIEFKVSTIFPRFWRVVHLPRPVDLYYSLYSVNPVFRRKWLPKALPHFEALPVLQQWVRQTGSRLYIHHALIAGENDSVEDAQACVDILSTSLDVPFRLNIVRYNPPAGTEYVESSEDQIQKYVDVWADRGYTTQIVNRVGYDVQASCGMFAT